MVIHNQKKLEDVHLSPPLEFLKLQRLLMAKGMLRSGFEPESRDRESRMIGRATLPERIDYSTCFHLVNIC